MGEVVDADAGQVEGRPPGRAGWRARSGGRRAPTRSSGRGRRCRCAGTPSGRGARRAPRPARPSRGSAPAPCSTALLEFMSFVYGKPIMRLSARRRADLLGACTAAGSTRAGWSAATSLKPRPQLGRSRPGARRGPGPAAIRSACSNSGYTCTGMTHAAGLLARGRHRHVGGRARGPAGTSSPCTVQSSSAPAAAGARPGAPRLRPAEQHEVGSPGLDGEAGLVHERLRAVAAHARQAWCREASAPSRSATRSAGIAVAPRQQRSRCGRRRHR